MDITRRTVLGGALAGLAVGAAGFAPASVAEELGRADLDWAGFLGTADLRWRKMPKTWYEGPFLGNGFLGSGIWRRPVRGSNRRRGPRPGGTSTSSWSTGSSTAPTTWSSTR